MPPSRVLAGASITTFPLANNTVCRLPTGIAAGSDGALWITESDPDVHVVARVTTTGNVTEYPLPVPLSIPQSITPGPDGALWFTENNPPRIGRITTAGSITEYGGLSGTPGYITAGPDGAMWFTERYTSIVGRITTAGVVTEITLPFTMEPAPITTGPDGNLWFFDDRAALVVKMTTAGAVTPYPITRQDISLSIVAGPDGNVWFTLRNTPGIGRMTTGGAYTFFPLADTRTPGGITTGPDGNLWLTESPDGVVARFSTAGVLTEYPLPTAPASQYITANSDGNLWIVEGDCTPSVVRAIPNRGPTPTISTAYALDVPGPLTLTASDPDDPPSILRYTLVSGPSHGTITGFNSDGTLTYSGNMGYSGPDSFTFTVSDGEKTSAPATLSLMVQLAVPVISGVNPSQLTSGGVPIDVIGDNFQAGATVQIDGIPATNVVVANTRSITAVAPNHGLGTVSVSVMNPNGQSGISYGSLRYVYAPPQPRGASSFGPSPDPSVPSRPGPVTPGATVAPIPAGR